MHYQLAAEYAISRRKLADEQCSQIQSYPAQDPLLQDTIFYGQRPWRSGKVEPVDMQREKEGIEALQYRERTKTKHCQTITRLQECAIEQFSNFKSVRMMNHVQVQMADELLIDQKHSRAMQILITSADMYRKEGWSTLSTACLLKAIKCAFLTVNVETYVNLCLSLVSSKSECNESEKQRIEQNFYLVLEGKAPLPEPSLTCKSERALVGQATKLWKDKLDNCDSFKIQVPTSSAVDLEPLMPKDVRLSDTINIEVGLINTTARNLEVNCHMKFNLDGYTTDGNLENLSLVSAKESKRSYQLQIKANDAGQKLIINELSFQIDGIAKFSFSKKLEDFDKKTDMVSNVLPRDSLVDVKFEGSSPALVGEWFDMGLCLQSREMHSATSIEVPFSIIFRIGDPLQICVSVCHYVLITKASCQVPWR